MLKFKIFKPIKFSFIILIFINNIYSEIDKPFNYVNLTGDFNNWNQADPNYVMEYIGDGVYEIVKPFYPGVYKFKFNIDKSWAKNFGSGDTPFSLKENGNDIKFTIDSPGFYKFNFYSKFNSYSIRKTEPKSILAYIKAKKFYYFNEEIELDGSESVYPKDLKVIFEWKEDKSNREKVINSKNVNKKILKFKLNIPGRYKYELTISAGKVKSVYSVEFEYVNCYSLISELTSSDSSDYKTFLEYQGNGIYEKILKPNKTERYIFRIVKNFKDYVTDEFSKELKSGKTYLLRFDSSNEDFIIEPKNYAYFYFNPLDYPEIKEKIVSVAVAGNFNNWNTEKDFLIKQLDGSYQLYLPLEEGIYYYKFVVNGLQWLFDKKSDHSLKINDGFGGFNSGIYIGDKASDFGSIVKNGINWEAVEHLPNDMKYFNPIGGNLIEIKVRSLKDDIKKVNLVYFTGSNENIIKLSEKIERFGFDYYSGIISIKNISKELKYYFIFYDGGKEFYYGNNYNSEKKPLEEKNFFKSFIGVKFSTPDWAKGIVWYQIMLDRFRNGSKDNDPDCVIPWNWGWYKKYDCEKWDENRFYDKRYGFYGWDGVWGRLYGGDLQGLIEKLSYLKELGIEGIYLNPVFESPSHHKYDTSDYRHIDDNFGFKGDNKNLNESLEPSSWKWTKTDRLFLEFLNKVHSLGIKVIIDGVFNHSGDSFWAFLDVKKNLEKSIYKDWYIITSFNPLQYEGWGGFGGLPVYREDENGLVEPVKKHIFDITRRWMDPNNDGDPSDGIDGWRLDVPNEVNHNFWKEWRKLVKSINPNAYITGEIWENASFWLKGEHFDAVMNYEFAKIVYRFFINTEKPYKISASQFDKELKELLASYPMQVNLVMQNLLDSHDTDRILSGIKNPNRYYDAKNRLQDEDGKGYDESSPTERELKIFKLIQLFQFTFIGSPMIWYGTEVGMFGADDPNNRRPMWWQDLMPYDDKDFQINNEIFEHTKKMIKIRKENIALKLGSFNTLFIDDKNEIYGFTRNYMEEKIYVILNNSWDNQKIKIKIEDDKKELKDILSGKLYKIVNNYLNLEIQAKYGVILK